MKPNAGKEEDRRIASQLVAFLMANAHHQTISVMRNNLDLIKGNKKKKKKGFGFFIL